MNPMEMERPIRTSRISCDWRRMQREDGKILKITADNLSQRDLTAGRLLSFDVRKDVTDSWAAKAIWFRVPA